MKIEQPLLQVIQQKHQVMVYLQIEQIIESHEDVLKCTVVAMPHPYKVQVAKAYIVLREGISPTLGLKKEIKDLCEKNLSKFSLEVGHILEITEV